MSMDKLQVISRKIATGAFLVLGVPYGIVILANVIYGWPCSQGEEDRYKRALQPARVLKVTYALAEQLNLVRFLPLFVRWTSYYRTASNVMKDVSFGRNENTLDVWTPQLTTDHHHTGGIHAGSPSDSAACPIVVFIYGGAWGSGDKSMYGLLAQQIIDHLGAVVVIPNYSIYPKGDVNDMVDDLHDVLAFIRSPEFSNLVPGADQQKVLLFGHSAGAHLCALATIDLVEMSVLCGRASAGGASEFPSATVRERCDPHEDHSAGNASPRHPQVPASGQSAAISARALLSSIRGVFGLGGVYHIMDHYQHESWRGVEDLSPMWRVMNGLDKFDDFSPTERVHKMASEHIERLPPFFIAHGTNDVVVPPSASKKFAVALTEREAKVTARMIVEGGHVELIIDMMARGRTFHDVMINLLMEVTDYVLRDED